MMPRSWAPVSATNKISVGQTFFIAVARVASGVIPGGLLLPDTKKEDPFHQDAKKLGSVRANGAQAGTHQARLCGFARFAAHGAATSGKSHAAGVRRRDSLRTQAHEG